MSFFIAFQEKNIDQLGAPRHIGTAKIGLDCSGRLLPGFLFDGNGNVVPSLNTNIKPKKRKKRLSDSCQNECKPCDDKIVIKKKPIVKTVKKIVIKANPSINKETLAKAKKTVLSLKKPALTFTNNGFFQIPIDLVFTDEKRFQNRNKLDQRIVNNIVKNFDVTQFDPIIIWQDTKVEYGHLGKYFVLAGHHRFEAVKQLGNKTIQAKIANYSEKEAIEFAKEKSNANRTLELPQERAKIYRAHIVADNLSKKEVLELAKTNEGKNANYIVNLAFLNSKGLTIQALDQLSETPDKQNATLIEKMADWIGEARKQFDGKLNDANETEMFKFLQDKNQSLRIKTKAEFLQKLTATVDAFWKLGNVLNLARFSNKTEGESVYETEYKDLQKQLETAINNKQSLIDRIKNPKHSDFIKPDDKDYKTIIVALEKAIEKYNGQIKSLQTKLIVLSRKKGSYTNAGSNQVGLFGTDQHIDTIKFNKQILLAKRNEFATTQIFQLGQTKDEFLKVVGKNKILLSGSVLKKAMSNKSKNHCLQFEDFINLPDFINNPIAIFKSETVNNAVVVLTEITNNLNKKVLVAFHLNEFIKINDIRTIYSKDRISIYKNWYKNGLLLYGNKKSDYFKLIVASIATKFKKSLSKTNITKIIPNNQNSELNIVHEAKIIEPEKKDNRITLANKFKNRSTINQFFKIYCNQLARFIGQIEIKPTFSVVMTLTGDEGSGKTRMCFQMMNAFAQNNKVGHASMEEQPDSNLYLSKQNDYLNQTAIENIESPEINSLNDLHNMILRNDVIVIDSYTKMKEINQGFEVDKDLRKKYNGKLFIVIFQQTTTGAMRGGSKSQFDADVVIFTQKFGDNYKKNYIYCTKNRYNKEIGLQYNIFNRALQGVTTVVQPQKFIENAQQILLEAPKQQILKFKVD